MKWMTIFALFAFNLAAAQTDARSIIEKSNEKIKSLKSIHLDVLYSDQYTGEITADVIISREQQAYPVFGVSKFKMTGIVITPNGSRNVSMAFNGNMFAYLNPEKKEMVLIESPTYSKIGRTGQLNYSMAVPAVYYEGAVFDSLIVHAVKYELDKDTVIFNQPAYTVRVTRNVYNKFTGTTDQFTSQFYFHKDSFLMLGSSSKWGRTFLKLKSVNDVYTSADFSFEGNTISRVTQQPKEVVYLGLNTQAPDWTLPSNRSGPITLSKLRGKVVMLDFWGTWCAPCLKSMPAVQSIHEHFKNKNVEVIGVSVEMEDAVDVPAFVKRNGYSYPIALDGKRISKDYKVTQYPTIYIIDKKGKIIFAGPGEDLEKKKGSIIQVIETALAD